MDKATSFEPGAVQGATDGKPLQIAIIGGGPGGLFTAWHLAAKIGLSCEVTIFEATDRVGGAIQTKQFAGVGHYEAGVAEIYDYSRLGPDPLHDLIVDELGLQMVNIRGGPCVLDGKIVLETGDLASLFGERARDEAESFRKRCADLLSPEAWYMAVAGEDNAHPWSKVRGDDLLEREFTDDVARRYIRAMANSDVAAPLHKTNGLTFLKNVLMDVDGYMDLFAVVGGNEQIMTRLAEELDPQYRAPRAFDRGRQEFGDLSRRRSQGIARIRLNSNVTAVEPLADGTYRIEMLVNGLPETVIADYVVVALPLTALSTVHWQTESLELAMEKHTGYFDRPGNYLRATFLFEKKFWREIIPTNWWMMDAFDGCCVYDESARYDYGGYGILAFLIAGNAALAFANQPDGVIAQRCLDALPAELAHGKGLVLDHRINRWMGTVSALPGGVPIRSRQANHRPDPVHAPRLVIVGDYLFDATLNGVMDSAEVASDIILADVVKRRAPQRAQTIDAPSPSEALNQALKHVEDLMSVESIADILESAWGVERGAKILHVGSGAGHTVAALRERGFQAEGVECSREAHFVTPPRLSEHNILGDFAKLPFDDGQFDAVIETGLCRTAPGNIEAAIAELHRVTKRGLLLGSVTSDLPVDLIERFNLLEGVQVLCSRWDWAERLYRAGFVHALFDRSRLGETWQKERLIEAWQNAKILGVGPSGWYEDSESMLYCVYERAKPILSQTRKAEARLHEQELVAAGLTTHVSARLKKAEAIKGR